MKHISKTLAAVVLAALMAFQLPVQVVSAADNGNTYISEVKIGMAEKEADAKTALENEGYTVLDCNLNQNAEGGIFSKGKKATYLGYKTTKKAKDAITDLAVMNMKGGYDTDDYDTLMDKYISGQTEPFVKNFISAIREYRTNYSSKIKANQTRAKVIHNLLNRFTDDDTGKKLGDLLLSETKYELGDDAYNKLSDAEKKNHADIVTIFAQANGQATLTIENLITRGSDTNDDTWIDRFSETTYDDLVESTEKTPTDAKSGLAKQYDDDANTIVEDLWDDFREELEGYDEAAENINSYDSSSYNAAAEAFNSIDENTPEAEKDKIIETYAEELSKYYDHICDLETVAVYQMLGETDYGDGTLLDFFTQDTGADDFDITCVYPMVASLTSGQRAGLDFVSLRELCVMAVTDEDGYSEIDTENIPEASVYDGVDRDIYAPGGVGFTSDALRTDAKSKMERGEGFRLSTGTIVAWCVTAVCFVGFVASAAEWANYTLKAKAAASLVDSFQEQIKSSHCWEYVRNGLEPEKAAAFEMEMGFSSTSNICRYFTIGFSFATIMMTALSLLCTFRDLQEHYNVTYTPQPRYMVDETDIIGYNKKSEKIIIKNQSAYYKIVPTNRDESAEFYSTLGTGNDINGDVGQQWLTLYSVKYKEGEPILANTLKAVVDSTAIPAGYETGIHLFGEDAAYNLNNTQFVWDEDAPSINVYYKTESTAASTSGSLFSAGVVALAGGVGLLIGAVLSAACMMIVKKRREEPSLS